MHSGFRRHDGFTPMFSVIPAQAGIYAPQWTPVFAVATDPHLFSVIPAQAGIYALRCTPVFAVATDLHLCFPSFRRKPESTRRDGLRFSPARRIHTYVFRHSGASRNLRAAMDSGFRRSDESTPKPPARQHYPARQRRGLKRKAAPPYRTAPAQRPLHRPALTRTAPP